MAVKLNELTMGSGRKDTKQEREAQRALAKEATRTEFYNKSPAESPKFEKVMPGGTLKALEALQTRIEEQDRQGAGQRQEPAKVRQVTPKGEMLVPASWAENVDGYQKWIGEYNQILDQAQADSKARDGVWQENFEDYIRRQSNSNYRLQRQAEGYMDFLDSHRDIYGDEMVDDIIAQLDAGRRTLGGISDYLRTEGEFRGEFKDKDAFDTYERLQSYQALPQEEDFEEKSAYRSTYQPGTEYFSRMDDMWYDTGYGDINYDYINRDKRARDRQLMADLRTGAAIYGYDNSERREMTDEEIAVFNYLYAQDEAKGDATHAGAYQYIQDLTGVLNARQREDRESMMRDFAEKGKGLASVYSLLNAPGKALSYLGQAADYIDDGKIDQNAGYNQFSYNNTAIRGQRAQDIAQTVSGAVTGLGGVFGQDWSGAGQTLGRGAEDLYLTGMSIGDSLINNALTGGIAGKAGVTSKAGKKFARNVGLSILGAGAAADATIRKKDMGYDDQRSFLLGTAAGAIEAVTEIWSLESLLDMTSMGRSAFSYFVKNFIAEGSEEGASDLLNWALDEVYDFFSGQSDSEWKRAVREKGTKEAFQDRFVEFSKDVLLGGLGGSMMAGANLAINDVYNANAGRQFRSMGEDVTQAIIQEGLDSPENTLSYDLARKLQTKLDAGKALRNAELGRLYRANVEQVESEIADGAAEDTDGAAELERDTGRPSIRPTWDTDAVLRQAALEMGEDHTESPLAPSEPFPPLTRGAEGQLYRDGVQEVSAQLQSLPESLVQAAMEAAARKDSAQLQSLPERLVQAATEAAAAKDSAQLQNLPEPLVQAAMEAAAREDSAQLQSLPERLVQAAMEAAAQKDSAQLQNLPPALVQMAQEGEAETIAVLAQASQEHSQLVRAQEAEALAPTAKEFGAKGRKALVDAWTGEQSMPDYYAGFALCYQAGLTGKDIAQVRSPYVRTLSDVQRQAAYLAGQWDAAVLAREKGATGFGETSGKGLNPSQEQLPQMEAVDQGRDGLTSGQTGSIVDTGKTSPKTKPLTIKQVKQVMTAQVDALPEEQRQALRRYTGSAAFRINGAIRSGKITPEIQQEIDLLDAALKDGVMPETVVLHRDTALSFLGLGLSEKPTAVELSRIVEQPITNDIFTSTSFNNLGFRGRNTELWLTVPAGYRGCRYIKSVAFSKYKYQEEVLFARGLRYRITEARIENEKYVLFAEVLQ